MSAQLVNQEKVHYIGSITDLWGGIRNQKMPSLPSEDVNLT